MGLHISVIIGKVEIMGSGITQAGILIKLKAVHNRADHQRLLRKEVNSAQAPNRLPQLDSSQRGLSNVRHPQTKQRRPLGIVQELSQV